MEIVRQYSLFIYIPLISLTVALLVILLVRAIRLSANLNYLSSRLDSINTGLNKAAIKSERIAKSKDSYTFFISLLTIFSLAKEVHNAGKKNTFRRSLARTLIRNSGKIRSIRL